MALRIQDVSMITSQGLGVVLNSILIMFYLWAKKVINPVDRPTVWPLMSMLITFFKHIIVQSHCSYLKEFLWHDEAKEKA